MSYASSLEADCFIEAVIPDHLAPLQRHLESFAFKIRRNGRSGGKKISTSVRLQDDGMTLALALKAEGDKRWTYYSKEQLKMNNERVQRMEEDSERASSTSRARRGISEEIDLTGESEDEEEGMDDEEAGESAETGEFRSAEEDENAHQ